MTKQEKLKAEWDKLQSQIYKVLDNEGVNMAHALVRKRKNGQYLYVDEMDGYQSLYSYQVRFLNLQKDL